MYRFIRKLILFSLPIIILLIGIVFTNPYGHPALPQNIFSIYKKKNIEYLNNQRLQKAIWSLHTDKKIIFIGDSRTEQLISPSCGDSLEILNLAFGGASFNEITSLTWSVLNNNNIETLYLGLNFDLYSLNHNIYLMEEDIMIANNPFTKYIFDPRVYRSFLTGIMLENSTENIAGFRHTNPLEKFKSKEEFWNYQIENEAKKKYENLKVNPYFFNQLDSISKYCTKMNIQLRLFSPPTNIELQEQKQVYNLNSTYEDFVLQMYLIDSEYLNLDLPTAFTKNKSNFRDPYHLSKGEKAFLNAILFRKENK